MGVCEIAPCPVVAHRLDDYFWFMGRADDVVKVAGNRIGTAEVESALVSHDAVVEAALIGKSHKTAGEMIKAFVILKQGHTQSSDLIKSLKHMSKPSWEKSHSPAKSKSSPHSPKRDQEKSCAES